MTPPVITKLPKSLVELKFVVTPEEAKPYLEQASQDIQVSKPIPGFRPGKAPIDEVKKAVGEMRLWETALERIVRARYVHTVLEEKLDTIGSPSISVDKLTPGQDIAFTVTVPVMPTVTKLLEYDKPLVTRNVRTVTEQDIENVIQDIRKMRREEVASDQPAKQDGAVVIDMDMTKDGVALEGGAAKNYKIYLAEPQYIPGFSDQLVGLKKGDEKKFSLQFPEGHYQKHLAGQSVDFTVKVNDVFDLKLPEVNDEFAKGIGIESVEKLHELLKGNLGKEAEQKADEAAEIELIEKLIHGSQFSEIPDLLVNEEVRRMYAELERTAEEQGMEMTDYLAQLKKTPDEVKLDMVPRALERIQAAVMIKEVAQREKVEIADEEVGIEIDRILSGVDDKDTRERVASPEYRDYVAVQMRNRKTLEALKKKAIKTEK